MAIQNFATRMAALRAQKKTNMSTAPLPPAAPLAKKPAVKKPVKKVTATNAAPITKKVAKVTKATTKKKGKK